MVTHTPIRNLSRGDEPDLKGHELGQGEPLGGADGGEIHQVQRNGDDVAHDHTDEDGAQLGDATGEVGQGDDHHQGDESHQPSLGGAKRRGARPAGHVLGRGGGEGEADGENHGTSDQGREEGPNPLDENAEDDGHTAADDLST